MTAHTQWKSSRQVADYFGISERTLCRWRQTGLFELGKHYRRKFRNPNSPLLYSLELCDQAMNDACARDVRTLELVAEG
jgi:hypothetical protein